MESLLLANYRIPSLSFSFYNNEQIRYRSLKHVVSCSTRFRAPSYHLAKRHRPCVTRSASFPLEFSLARGSFNASLNLVSVFGLVILVDKLGYLPSNTPYVLSQVSFNLVIPCFLMSKVCKMVAAQGESRFIIFPLIAVLQVLIGIALGKLSCILLFRRSKDLNSDLRKLAVKEALVTTACAFGNSVTLPLIFLNGMLQSTDYAAAVGYLAFYLAGWSSCLWTLGYQIMSSSSRQNISMSLRNWRSFSLPNIMESVRMLLKPPIYGVIFGILLGLTPIPKMADQRIPSFNVDGLRGVLALLLTSISSSLLEAVNLIGSATVPLQAIILASTLGDSNQQGTSQANERLNEKTATKLDGKAFWMVTVVRLLVAPMITLGMMIVIQKQGWLPDNISKLTILVLSAMPTAQNLIILAQLHTVTQPFAGVFANFLVNQYFVSILTVTIWVPIFCSFLHISI